MASKRAAEAEAQRDAALQKAEEAKLQRDSIEGDQRRQDAVQNVIDQWQQRPSAFQPAGLPVVEPAPVPKASTDAPAAVAPEQMLSGTRSAPPLSPRDVITQQYDGGVHTSVPLPRQSVFNGKGSREALFVLSVPWPTPVGGIVMKSCFTCQVLCVGMQRNMLSVS